MLRNKNVVFVIFMAIVLVLTACGGGNNETVGTQPTQSGSSESEQAQQSSDAVIPIRIAHSEAAESIYQKGAVKLQELLEEKSAGRFEVEVFPSGQLGGQRDLFEAVQMGGIEMSIQNTSTAANFIEEVDIVGLPFIWPNEEVMWQVLDSDASQLIHEAIEETGIKAFGFWAGGFKSITSKGKPILEPSDLQGVKFRVIPSPMLLAQYEAWGANPEPIDYGELYNALQLGVVDAQDNTREGIFDMKFYEVQDYLSVTDHSYFSVVSIANLDWFNNLPADLQEVVIEAEKEAADYQRELMKARNEEVLDEMKDFIEIQYPTAEQKEEFVAKSDVVYEMYANTERKKEIFNTIQEAVKATAK